MMMMMICSNVPALCLKLD